MSFASLILRTRDSLQRPALDILSLATRLVFGWQFFLTGRGKLQHLDRTTEFFASLHIPAPGAHALGIGTLECVGGLLLILGVGTRGLAALLSGTMVVALLTAHRADIVSDGLDGLFAAPPFPYLLATLFLVVSGPGRIAMDRLLESRLNPAIKPAPART